MAVRQRGEPAPPLEAIAHTQLRQFAAEATAMELSDFLDIAQPGRRQTLLITLLRQARMRCRDELVEMMLRRIRRTQALTREQLEALHDQRRGIEEVLINVFGQLLETAHVQGGVDALAAQCETVSAWHRDNDLFLLWPIHARHRVLLLCLIDQLDIRSATQDRSLLDVWSVVSAHTCIKLSHTWRPDGSADIGFASQRWRNYVVRCRPEIVIDQRALEICVFIHLVDALQIGDLYVVGAAPRLWARSYVVGAAPTLIRVQTPVTGLLRDPRLSRTGQGFSRRCSKPSSPPLSRSTSACPTLFS